MTDGALKTRNDYVVAFLNEHGKEKVNRCHKHSGANLYTPHYNSPDICAGGCSKIITLLFDGPTQGAETAGILENCWVTVFYGAARDYRTTWVESV